MLGRKEGEVGIVWAGVRYCKRMAEGSVEGELRRKGEELRKEEEGGRRRKKDNLTGIKIEGEGGMERE